MPRPRFLFMGGDIPPEWRPLHSLADVSELRVPGESATFEGPGERTRADLQTGLEIARANSGRFDYILAECTGAFLWHCLFRLVGDQTPFVIVPRFNHVHAQAAYALLLSSQFVSEHDLVFCGSRASSQAFGMFGFRCSPLYLPGIDLRSFRSLSSRRAEIRALLGIHRDHDLLLYVGRMADDKNVVELLRAVEIVRESRDARLVLCFHFPTEKYLAQCRAIGDSIGEVSFIEAPDTQRLVHWYNAADLFVSAAVSVFETFGRAPVEAMACGTPPVVSAYNGFRETVTEDNGFLVPTRSVGYRKQPDVPRFAETIVEALEDKRGLARKSQSGRLHARRFGKGRSVRAMLKELHDSHHSPPSARKPKDGLRLDRYPPEVAEMWAPLEGEVLEDLVTAFLTSGKVPIRPSEREVRNFYMSWFSHY